MIFQLSEKDQMDIRKVINHLLAINFLVKEVNRELYYIARRNREALEQFFSFLDWDLVMDDRHETIYVSSSEGIHKMRLTKEESIWMLIIKLLYHEKREGISLSQFPMVTLYEIKAKYQTFRIPFVTKTKLLELVRLSQKYQLIEALDNDIQTDDAKFRLFHSWLYLIDTEAMDTLHEKIKRFELGEEEWTNEMDDQAEAN